MIYLHTLGELRLEGTEGPSLSSPRKELTLLAYLARRAPRAASRPELAALLWDAREETKARKSLRQALFELKRTLGGALTLESDRAHLATDLMGWDVGDFERALDAGDFEQATERWKGDFLTGAEDQGGEEFRAWLEVEREHLRKRLRWGFERLAEDSRRRGAWAEGIARARRWVEALPFDVEGHQQLIELLHLDGRAPEALAHHAAFHSRFRSEFGTDLPVQFLELSNRLERAAAASGPRLPTSAALFTPDLIGRGAALAELMAAWHSVQAGAAAGVLVEGEAGIGKTRLCEELLARLREDQGPVVLEARAHESEQGTELTLLKRVLEGLAEAPGLAGAPPGALAELARLSPAVAERFPGVPPASHGRTTFDDALLQALDAVAQEQPVVVYIDDLIWADRASQRALVALAGRLHSAVLLLISVRTSDPEPSPEVTELGSRPLMRRLKLQPLSLAGVEALLGSMMRLEAAERHALARRLHAQGSGNPFFTIELTAALVDDGLLTPTESGPWRLEADAGEALPLPASIRDVVGRRLSRVSPPARMAAEGAAVLGRGFDPELVCPVAGLSPPETAVALEELIARKLVRESRGSPGMYEFTHEITWRVTYDLLPAARRETLHTAAATVWESKARRSPAARAAAEYHRQRAGAHPRPGWFSHRPTRVAAVLGSVMVLGTWALMSRGAPVPFSTNRVAVFPFTVRGPQQYQYLREGLPTLLSVAIDGADSLRPVDPGVVLRALEQGGQAMDPLGAESLAERLGAQLYVLGDVVGAAGKLRISAAVYDRAQSEVPLARVAAEGRDEEIFSLADALTRQLLAARSPSAGASLTRVAALTTSSLEAFKSYMEGEHALRERRTGTALDAFQRAITLDTAFALAHYQLAVSQRVTGQPDSALAQARRALRYGSRLPEAHRMLLRAMVASLNGEADNAERLYRKVVADHPENLEAWYMLGELLQHGNPLRGRSMVESKPAFERMLAIVPRDGRAIWHLARVAAVEGNPGKLDSLLRQVDSTSDDASRARILRAFAIGDHREQENVLTELRRGRSVAGSVEEIAVLTHDLEGAQKVADLLGEPARSRRERAVGLILSTCLRSARGQWKGAMESLAAAHALDPTRALVAIAFLSTQPLLPLSRSELSNLRARLVAGLHARGLGDSVSPARYPYLRPYLLGLVDARLRGTGSVAAYAAELERGSASTYNDSVAQRLGRQLRAHVLHADSGPAISLSYLRLQDLFEWWVPAPFDYAFAPSGYERFLRAEWLRELGRDEEALGWYAGLDQESLTGLIYVAPGHLRQAEIYERRGDFERARAHYRSFIHWWREADPELQPLVDSVRTRLASLGQGQ